MASLWPWLAVAGIGALHGLNPATGWMLAAAWGVRSRDRAQALRALVPIAVGHAASVALVAAAVAFGLSMDRVVLQALAGGLLVVVAIAHLSGRTPKRARAPAGHAGLALWSFMMSTAHGAGLMLVPALMPLCMGDASAPRDHRIGLAGAGARGRGRSHGGDACRHRRDRRRGLPRFSFAAASACTACSSCSNSHARPMSIMATCGTTALI